MSEDMTSLASIARERGYRLYDVLELWCHPNYLERMVSEAIGGDVSEMSVFLLVITAIGETKLLGRDVEYCICRANSDTCHTYGDVESFKYCGETESRCCAIVRRVGRIEDEIFVAEFPELDICWWRQKSAKIDG